MTDIQNDKDSVDDYCEECGCEDESVSQNLLMFGYKICVSCRISKTIFPLQVILLIGRLFNLLITKETDKIANIKNDKDHLDDYCEECGCEDESVSQNLLMFGYKICASCKISKTIFPI